MLTMKQNLADMLLSELEERGWTQAELAKRSGITPAQISRIISGQRGAETKTLVAIANALKMPPDTLLHAAELLPPDVEENEITKEIKYRTSELPVEDQKEVLEYVKYRQRLAEKRAKYETRRTKPRPAT